VNLFNIGITLLFHRIFSLACKTYSKFEFHHLKNVQGTTIATRSMSKWGGVMIKLAGLSPCLLY